MDFGGALPSWGAAGGFLVSLPTGDLTGILSPGDAGAILDLSAATEPVGVTFPAPGFLASFISFPVAASQFRLDLDWVYAGVNPLGTCLAGPPPDSCTPIMGGGLLSPFNLDNGARGSSIAFEAGGLAYNDADGDATWDAYWVGTFTAQFAGQNYQAVMATLMSQGYVDAAYSGNVKIFIPEPATFGLIGIGLLAIGLTRFRAKYRNR